MLSQRELDTVTKLGFVIILILGLDVRLCASLRVPPTYDAVANPVCVLPSDDVFYIQVSSKNSLPNITFEEINETLWKGHVQKLESCANITADANGPLTICRLEWEHLVAMEAKNEKSENPSVGKCEFNHVEFKMQPKWMTNSDFKKVTIGYVLNSNKHLVKWSYVQGECDISTIGRIYQGAAYYAEFQLDKELQTKTVRNYEEIAVICLSAALIVFVTLFVFVLVKYCLIKRSHRFTGRNLEPYYISSTYTPSKPKTSDDLWKTPTIENAPGSYRFMFSNGDAHIERSDPKSYHNPGFEDSDGFPPPPPELQDGEDQRQNVLNRRMQERGHDLIRPVSDASEYGGAAARFTEVPLNDSPPVSGDFTRSESWNVKRHTYLARHETPPEDESPDIPDIDYDFDDPAAPRVILRRSADRPVGEHEQCSEL